MARPDTLLEEYRRRRDFDRTPEPDHRRADQPAEGLAFVVQKHDASRLHYDFRLEWEGVLKSWAVTKGPSYDPSDKRLAVRTEDHPLSYGDFEGTIPKGQYGGGTVMLWDRGSWIPENDPADGLREGKLNFELRGERLKGKWSLVRMRSKRRGDRENWLLVKARDDLAGRAPDLLATALTSVVSGRTMAAIAGGEPAPPKPRPKPGGGAARRRSRAATALPRWRQPQLATLVKAAPAGDGYFVEMKYDGYRVLIAVAGETARIYTRNGKDWTDRFRPLAEAACALGVDSALLDGEVVAFSQDGRTDFSTLQAALKNGGELACFVFDLLELDGADLAAEPLHRRKQRLAELLGGVEAAPLHYSEHVAGDADAVLERICASGHEGIIAKRADRPYRGGRSTDWLKVKCSRRQEFVIGGFAPSDKPGRPFSSILVGVNEPGGLVYAGRVGSGFDQATLRELSRRFERIGRKTSPFRTLPAEIAASSRFVRPSLVAEVDFAEFTADGYVRHGVFKGLREDKDAAAIVRETPRDPTPMPKETRDVIAGIRLTSPTKVLFKKQGVTKADLAAYYERVAERMLPYIAGRPISLVRCPDGRGEACFYQKHAMKGFPGALRSMAIAQSDGRKTSHLYVEDLSGLVAGVQMGTLEFHIWGSRIDRLEQPDRLVFDLDPDGGMAFDEVKAAAGELRDRLAGLGLQTLPLVTGGKGVHVVAPLQRRSDWAEVKAFARGFATMLAGEQPERYVATASKAKRAGRIFIDYLRNERGATAVAPYSTRARPGCPVATPLSWEELAGIGAADQFSLGDILDRLQQPDPWAAGSGWRQSVTRSMQRAVSAEV